MQDSQATTIYLVRHGHVHNPRDILYGRLPRFALSTLGREQAARTAQFLSGQCLAAVYSSPQLRARQTAAAIAASQPGLPVRVSSLLAEIKTSWQGSSSSALGKYFDFYGNRREPDDETICAIFERMRCVVTRLCRRHPGQHVVCVSHGDPILIARTGLAGLPLVFANLRGPHYPEHCSLTVLTFDCAAGTPLIRYVDLTAGVPSGR